MKGTFSATVAIRKFCRTTKIELSNGFSVLGSISIVFLVECEICPFNCKCCVPCSAQVSLTLKGLNSYFSGNPLFTLQTR